MHANRIVLLALFWALSFWAAPAAMAQTEAVTVPEVDTNYRLQAGDKLIITVFGEPDLSGEFTVAKEGTLAYPLLGALPVQNLTLGQFQNKLVSDLKNGYLQDPKVSIAITNYRPFYILGEVNKPGEYSYSGNINIINAVAMAGGFTYRAVTRRVYIRRAGDAEEKEYPVKADTQVLPGDTIRIDERFF